MDVPQPLDAPNSQALRAACQAHIAALAQNTPTEDDAHRIYEAAMGACYGSQVWDWVNAQTNEGDETWQTRND